MFEMRDLNLADRLNDVPTSLLVEIAALLPPDGIALSNGNPGAETFPIDKFNEIAAKYFAEDNVALLRYNSSKGYEPLRQSQKAYLAQRLGFDWDRNDIAITVGGQQAVAIAASMLVRPGSIVLTEDRTFDTCMYNFLTQEAEVQGITTIDIEGKYPIIGTPHLSQGMDPEELYNVLLANQLPDGTNKVSAIYTIPTFQNPSGGTASSIHRDIIYAIAVNFNVPIIEDDPYFELRIEGKDQDTYKYIDDQYGFGLVFYAGSWSKTMCPALRCGFLTYPKSAEYEKRLGVALEVNTIHPAVVSQYIINECIDADNNFAWYKAHVQECRTLYTEKRNAMVAAFEKYGSNIPGLSWTVPKGGMFMTAQFPKGFDTLEFAKGLIEAKKVAVIPGAAFYRYQEVPRDWVRLCYAGPTVEKIDEGIKGLCEYYAEVANQPRFQLLNKMLSDAPESIRQKRQEDGFQL